MSRDKRRRHKFITKYFRKQGKVPEVPCQQRDFSYNCFGTEQVEALPATKKIERSQINHTHIEFQEIVLRDI